MKTALSFILKSFAIHFSVITIFSFLFRIYTLFKLPFMGGAELMSSLVTGLLFDFTVAIYLFWPFVVLMLFVKNSQKKWIRVSLGLMLAFSFFIGVISFFGEYFFFQEFSDRFNFIAVDYLVYSQEVLENIWESYPLVPILLGVSFVSLMMGWFILKNLKIKEFVFSLKEKSLMVCIYAFLFVVALGGINENSLLETRSASNMIVSKNGFHALFAAYRNNQIDYEKFYTSIDSKVAIKTIHEIMETESEEKLEKATDHIAEQEDTIIRNIVSEKQPLKLNVMFVLMESLSAKYLGVYGGKENITPNLDELSKKGLFFNRLYATGTRTVRGIEATTLSIPPTPGQSIVRRPGGVGLFTIGSVFRDQAYETKFIYGGYSFFDNMGAFFSGNQFSIVDRADFKKSEISFTNAWGVCDEDLYAKAISEADKSYAQNKRFFNFLLTTSNHRPYTYPQKIDIPSGTSRYGAVKYSDFSIGEFLKAAEKKPWFKSTVFVFISDHNASVAGGEEIKPSDYLIPLIIYSPEYIKPEINSNLASQIDVAPTLLGLLNFSYQSKFFGTDLSVKNPHRAFLATYQKVGYMDDDMLTVLTPNKRISSSTFTENGVASTSISERIDFLSDQSSEEYRNTVSYYKTAAEWYAKGFLKLDHKIEKSKNIRVE